MRNSLINVATDMFREGVPETMESPRPIRWFACVEAIAACGLLVVVGVLLIRL